MSEVPLDQFYSTNAGVYFAIAQEAFAKMKAEDTKNIRPKPNGEPGSIIILDSDRNSFKNALISLVFCGVYLEAMLHILLAKRVGLARYERIDRKPYEEKLKELGCSDSSLISDVKKYRLARKEVVHEKSLMNHDSLLVAQQEAAFAINMIEKFQKEFRIEMQYRQAEASFHDQEST